MAEGIEVRHGKDCASREGRRCNCKPSFRASLWSGRERKKIKRTFPTEAAARVWLQDARVGLRKGTLSTPKPITVRQACEAYIAGMENGTIRTPSGDPYKPGVIRNYRGNLRRHAIPRFGSYRLGDVRHVDVQDWVDGLLAAGSTPGRVDLAVTPLRTVYRRAVKRGDVAVNPVAGLELPADRSRRDRIAGPEEAEMLIAALPTALGRALWGTAMYAGLRLGEMQALRWDDVDLAGGKLRVERGWDQQTKRVLTTKTRAGVRSVPIVPMLRDLLLDLRLDQAKVGADHGYVFGIWGGHGGKGIRRYTPDQPFAAATLRLQAERAWAAAGMTPIGFHECRHTFASLMIAAGVNAKALTTYLGHTTIAMTYDRYGHLMPGNEAEAARLLDTFLREKAAERARLAGQ